LASAKATKSGLITGFKNHPKEPAGVNRRVVGQHTTLRVTAGSSPTGVASAFDVAIEISHQDHSAVRKFECIDADSTCLVDFAKPRQPSADVKHRHPTTLGIAFKGELKAGTKANCDS